jgi:hypothetical protein
MDKCPQTRMMFCLNNLSYFRLAQIPSSMPLDLTLSIFLFWCHDIQTKCIIMRTELEAPVRQKNLRSAQDLSLLIDNLFVLLICFTKNIQVSFFTNGHFQPTPFQFSSNASSLTPLIRHSLFLSLPSSPLTHHSVFTYCNFT